jgi:phage/plasmid-associated DNA primase
MKIADQYKQDVADFLAQACLANPSLGGRTSAKDLYRAYVHWALASGRGQVARAKTFGVLLGQRFPRIKLATGHHYVGVRLPPVCRKAAV